MTTTTDIYTVFTVLTPMYAAMFLGYASMRWWKIFTPDQSAAIHRFITVFGLPFLTFHYISLHNPYHMNLRFLAADTLQKLYVLLTLGISVMMLKEGNLEWMLTNFSLFTLPNTLVVGIPLLTEMYGEDAGSLMVQVLLLECTVWQTLLVFLYEFCAARRLIIREQFPATAADCAGDKMPPVSVTARLTIIMVGRKLIRSPIIYASVFGLILSLVLFRWDVSMPVMMVKSISIISDAGPGMAMFGLGLYLGLQENFLECAYLVAFECIGLRFLCGPIVMLAASLIVGLHGTLLHISVIQAALPLGIIPLMLGKEYNVYPAWLSTVGLFGMWLALPITLLLNGDWFKAIVDFLD